MADEWIAPGGYHLCAHGKCGEPKATAKRLDDETSWKCEGTCEKDGDHDCGCCQVAVPPRGKQVIILAEPGDEWKWERLAPGWGTACLCLYKDGASQPKPQYDLKAPTAT
jgi:hypothetical protein